jgi:FKBP-type peptidyl-prolyl cis-trans isomerase
MISSVKKSQLLAVTAALLLAVVPAIAQASQEAPRLTAASAGSVIQLSFKLDPRVVDSFANPGEWVGGPPYMGATAQDTVEVVAQVLDAKGQPTKASLEWVPSDPAMVTVSPRQGNDVNITVHRVGESRLKITCQGGSRELVITAQSINNFKVFEITEATAEKPKQPAATEALPPRQTKKTKNDVSYAAGMNLARALEEQSVEVDVALLMQGVKDALSGGKTLMTVEEALAALEGLQIDQRIVEAGLNRKAIADKNKREGEAFLAANKNKEGVVTLPSGLQYKIIKASEGKKPTADDSVTVRYRGTFIDEKEFDNTFDRKTPVSFPVKAVIKGWTEALQLMPVGSRWQLFVPSELAYGERGAGGGGGKRAGGFRPQTVEPNATLIFDVDLLSAEPGGKKTPASNVTTEETAPNPDQIIDALKKAMQLEKKNQTKEPNQ